MKVIFCFFRVLTQVFKVNTNFQGQPGLIHTFFHCLIDFFSPGSLRIGLLRLQSELGGSKKVIMKMLSDIECGPGIGSCGGVRFEGLYQ